MAFANAEGGTIAIGLSEGRIEGIGEHDENGLRQAARTFTDPPVRHRFRLVPCTTSTGRSDRVALMEIEASESVHRMANGDVFLRVRDENRRLAALEVLELEYDKGQSVFDGRAVPGATPADLRTDARFRARDTPGRPGDGPAATVTVRAAPTPVQHDRPSGADHLQRGGEGAGPVPANGPPQPVRPGRSRAHRTRWGNERPTRLLAAHPATRRVSRSQPLL